MIWKNKAEVFENDYKLRKYSIDRSSSYGGVVVSPAVRCCLKQFCTYYKNNLKNFYDVAIEGAEPCFKPQQGIVRVEYDQNLYSFCGPMWRNIFPYQICLPWCSWQMNTSFDSRTTDWKDNLQSDYESLYYYIKGKLPQTDVNVGSYRRLLDKGYLIKDRDGYKVNVIISQSLNKWYEFIAPATDELFELSRQYSKLSFELLLVNQPEHVHEIVKYYSQNNACSLHTYIMNELIEKNVLKRPTPEQTKSLCTVLFLDK